MNLYVDNEWYRNQKIFLHSTATDYSRCYQLWGSMLTKENIIKSLQPAKKGYIFFYGPDIGMIEKQFKINIRDNYVCINLLSVFRYQLPKRSCYKLESLEQDFGLTRKIAKYKKSIFNIYSDFHNVERKKDVLLYNQDDVINLRQLKQIIFKKYPISEKELIKRRLK